MHTPNKCGFKICEKLTHDTALEQRTHIMYSLISRTFLLGIWPVFCLRLIRATHPGGQSFPSAIALTEQKMTFSGQMFATSPMTQMKKMKMTPTTIYRTYRRTSFFRRRRFLRFWTTKVTFITFACKNQYFVVDWSRRVFTGEKVNWPAAYSWTTLGSRYMAKISAATYLRMRLTSEYMQYVGQCDCSWRAHIWYSPVHLITVVHPWKILVHPGVYDTPSWQALP